MYSTMQFGKGIAPSLTAATVSLAWMALQYGFYIQSEGTERMDRLVLDVWCITCLYGLVLQLMIINLKQSCRLPCLIMISPIRAIYSTLMHERSRIAQEC